MAKIKNLVPKMNPMPSTKMVAAMKPSSAKKRTGTTPLVMPKLNTYTQPTPTKSKKKGSY